MKIGAGMTPYALFIMPSFIGRSMRNKRQMRDKKIPMDSPLRPLRSVILNSFQDLTRQTDTLNQVQHDSKGCLFVFFCFCLLLLGCLVACQQVQKPELKGEGPLAVVVPRGSTAPEYHAPIERWRIFHMEAIHRGDFTERECVLCHNPKTGCNRCHHYIGAKLVVVPEADLYWPEGKDKK